MSEGKQDMPVQKEPFNLFPFEGTADKIGHSTFNNFGEATVLNQSALVRGFFTKGLLAVYQAKDLVGVEVELLKKKGLMTQELMRSIVGKVDPEKFKEELGQANEKVGSFDFNQPSQLLKFIQHFGLLDPNSPMSKITQEVYDQLPPPVKQALAIKAF